MLLYPDIELTLVQYFNQALVAQGTPLATGVRVATKYAQPDQQIPAKQVIITGSYNGETDDMVTKLASVTIEVYADDYEVASTLALLVEALVRNATVQGIKRATVRLGPVRTSDESTFERRSIDVELVVKASQA